MQIFAFDQLRSGSSFGIFDFWHSIITMEPKEEQHWF